MIMHTLHEGMKPEIAPGNASFKLIGHVCERVRARVC